MDWVSAALALETGAGTHRTSAASTWGTGTGPEVDWVPAGFSLGTGTAAGANWIPATPTRGTGMGAGESYVQPAGGTGIGPKSQVEKLNQFQKHNSLCIYELNDTGWGAKTVFW